MRKKQERKAEGGSKNGKGDRAGKKRLEERSTLDAVCLKEFSLVLAPEEVYEGQRGREGRVSIEEKISF